MYDLPKEEISSQEYNQFYKEDKNNLLKEKMNWTQNWSVIKRKKTWTWLNK